jgi:hypothetical protein
LFKTNYFRKDQPRNIRDHHQYRLPTNSTPSSTTIKVNRTKALLEKDTTTKVGVIAMGLTSTKTQLSLFNTQIQSTNPLMSDRQNE